MRRLAARGIALALALALCGAGGCVSQKRITRAEGQLTLGTAYLKEGNIEASIATLRKAAKEDPRNWRVQSVLGVAYVQRDEPELAEQAFKRALRINPGAADILNNYGTMLLKYERYEEAVVVLEEARNDMEYRQPALVLSNLSLALTEAGRPAEGVRRAQEAIQRAPNLCEAHFHLGLALERAGDKESAIEAYGQQAQLCPQESTGALLRVGCLQAETGDTEAARATLTEILLEAPSSPLSSAAKECLARLP